MQITNVANVANIGIYYILILFMDEVFCNVCIDYNYVVSTLKSVHLLSEVCWLD